jgi:hypothetical protein
MDAWLALMAEDVVVRSVAAGAPGMEFSAPRDGKAALAGYFAGLAADWEMVHHTAELFLADGDWVAVFGRCEFTHRRTGKTAATPIIHRVRFRDGLIVEFHEYYDTATAFAAATPDPA